MNRTPIFFLNGVLVIVLVPLLFFLGVKSGGGRGGFDFILQAIASGRKFYVILATAGFLVFCSSLNGTASSTFSREGGQFWISKVIPVSWRKQVQAKFFHSYLIALLGVAGGGVVAWLTFKMKALDFVIAAALALAAAAALTAIGMAIDLARPLLDWINPQKAIKQNLNVLLAILADILVLTLLTFFSLWLSRRGLPPYLALALLLLVLLLAVGGAFALLFYLAERRYPRIEI